MNKLLYKNLPKIDLNSYKPQNFKKNNKLVVQIYSNKKAILRNLRNSSLLNNTKFNREIGIFGFTFKK